MYKETYPSPYLELIETQPLLTRIFHWSLFFLIITLSITGYLLHEPGWLNIQTNTLRYWHVIAGYLLLWVYLAYSYYYLWKKYFHSIIFKLRDIKYVPVFLKYYLFIQDEQPYYGKYNPGQKLVFSLWVLLVFFMILTGLTLRHPTSLQFLTYILGELSWVRLLHFLGAVIFYITIPVHLYLALTSDPAKLQAIFSGYTKK